MMIIIVPIFPRTNLGRREAMGLLKATQLGFESGQPSVEPFSSRPAPSFLPLCLRSHLNLELLGAEERTCRRVPSPWGQASPSQAICGVRLFISYKGSLPQIS